MNLIPNGNVTYDVYAEYGNGDFLGSHIDGRYKVSESEAMAWAKYWKEKYDAHVVIVRK